VWGWGVPVHCVKVADIEENRQYAWAPFLSGGEKWDWGVAGGLGLGVRRGWAVGGDYPGVGTRM